MKSSKPNVFVASSDDKSASLELAKMSSLAGKILHPVFDFIRPDSIDFHAGVFARSGATHNQRRCVSAGRITLESEKAVISPIVTDPNFRGLHLGSAVMTALETVAKDRCFPMVFITEPVPAEVGFFRELGYQPSKYGHDDRVAEISKTL